MALPWVVSQVPSSHMRTRKDAYGVHMANGKGYVFSINDLPQTYAAVQLRESIALDYACRLVQFFSRCEVIRTDECTSIIEAVYSKTRTLR